MKKLYVVISQTGTGFAKALRKFGNLKYNHASIALDKDLIEMYGYARKEQYGYFVAGLVKETTDRFIIGTDENDCAIAVFELDVTQEQYEVVKQIINVMYENKSYKYNLFSVLTHPLFGGYSSYNLFTCIEFVMFILQSLGVKLEKPASKYKPDELLEVLSDKLIYEGSLLEYITVYTKSPNYFNSVSVRLIGASVKNFCIISKRSFGTLGRYLIRKISI